MEIENRDYYTVMIHFYRGELGRIMTWRQRLDVTTNWAVVAVTGLLTFSLSSPQNTHLVFVLANLICLLLLVIEGRRYRYYDAFRARVRMLEAHLIMPVLMRGVDLPKSDWPKIMAEDLVCPSFKISRLEAIARRFKRNYVYLFLMILVGWFLKLWLHAPESHQPRGIIAALMRDNPIPLWLFLLGLAAFYGFLLALLIRSLGIGNSSGEFTSGAMRRGKWLE